MNDLKNSPSEFRTLRPDHRLKEWLRSRSKAGSNTLSVPSDSRCPKDESEVRALLKNIKSNNSLCESSLNRIFEWIGELRSIIIEEGGVEIIMSALQNSSDDVRVRAAHHLLICDPAVQTRRHLRNSASFDEVESSPSTCASSPSLARPLISTRRSFDTTPKARSSVDHALNTLVDILEKSNDTNALTTALFTLQCLEGDINLFRRDLIPVVIDVWSRVEPELNIAHRSLSLLVNAHSTNWKEFAQLPKPFWTNLSHAMKSEELKSMAVDLLETIFIQALKSYVGEVLDVVRQASTKLNLLMDNLALHDLNGAPILSIQQALPEIAETAEYVKEIEMHRKALLSLQSRLATF